MAIGSVPQSPTHPAAVADTPASGSSSKQVESSPVPTAGKYLKREGAPLIHASGNKRPKWIPPLEKLSNELLLKITAYLDSPDLGNVRLTNQRLNNIGSAQHITPLRFDKPEELAEAINIFTSRGQIDKIRSITLFGDNFGDQHLSMVAQFTKVEELHLARCRNLTDACAPDISRFRHLKKLNVGRCYGLTDQFVAQLYPATPGETLDVALEEVNFSWLSLTDACAPEISRFRHLKKLDVRNCSQLTDQFVAQLYPTTEGETLDIALEEVRFSNSQGLTNRCAAHISRFRNLKKLEISECRRLTDQFIAQLYPATEGETLDVALEEVSFADCHQLTDACAPDISRFRHLKKLDVSSCNELTDRFVAQLYPATAGETLDVALEEVNLFRCRRLTDACARDISRFPHLKKLNVGRCSELTDQFVAQLYPATAGETVDIGLEEVGFNDCTKLTDACAPSISRFRHLQKLDVSDCWNLTDQFVAQLYPPMEGETLDVALTEVKFNYCPHLTDACAADISRFRHLKKLDVSKCTRLSDQFVAQLYPATAGETPDVALEEVHFFGCDRLSDGCAPHISRFRHLKMLNVSWCLRLTDQFVAQLYRAEDGEAVDIPLKEVDFFSCHQITGEALVSLAARAKGLRFTEKN